MLDGFNEGWIEFQDDGTKAVKGRTNVASVIAALVVGTGAQVSPSAGWICMSAWGPQEETSCVSLRPLAAGPVALT